MSEIIKQPESIKSLMNNEMVKSKFAEILGKNARKKAEELFNIVNITKNIEQILGEEYNLLIKRLRKYYV